MQANPKVDWYCNKATTWTQAVTALRAIALDCELTEELKWGCPCHDPCSKARFMH
jgi:uncharacterized protein YdeI (YjbR/CyaY-like superfamily)